MELRKGITKGEFSRLQSAALRAWKADKQSARTLGKALNTLRAAFKRHGQFTKWLIAHKIDVNRSSYCRRLANGEHAASRRRRLRTISVKQRALKPFIIKLDLLYSLSQNDKTDAAARKLANSIIAMIQRRFLHMTVIRTVIPVRVRERV